MLLRLYIFAANEMICDLERVCKMLSVKCASQFVPIGHDREYLSLIYEEQRDN